MGFPLYLTEWVSADCSRHDVTVAADVQETWQNCVNLKIQFERKFDLLSCRTFLSSSLCAKYIRHALSFYKE